MKEAIVVVLAALGEAHGYAIMSELKDRIGGRWKPSPGGIYPARLALAETGHVVPSLPGCVYAYRTAHPPRRPRGPVGGRPDEPGHGPRREALGAMFDA